MIWWLQFDQSRTPSPSRLDGTIATIRGYAAPNRPSPESSSCFGSVESAGYVVVHWTTDYLGCFRMEVRGGQTTIGRLGRGMDDKERSVNRS